MFDERMFDVAFTRAYMFDEHPEIFNMFECWNMFVEHVRPCKGRFIDLPDQETEANLRLAINTAQQVVVKCLRRKFICLDHR
jgi:hypothetical protein